MKNMKKILSFILCLTLVLSMAACGSSAGSTPETESTPTPEVEATPEAQPEKDENAESGEPETPDVALPEGTYVSYLSLYLAESSDSYKSITASDDFMGGAYVEYIGDVKKVGTFDFAILEQIAAELAASGLMEFNGVDEYTDGEAYASMYIELSDGSYLTAGYSGAIADEFIQAFDHMDNFFQTLTAELEEYVPQAQVMGELDADLLAAMQEIVNNSGMEGLDSLAISEIVLDEYFAFTAGLSSTDGISAGASCAAMMMTTPYSLVIVKLDDAANIGSVRADFESSLDWQKWVCVIPSSALIAEKDNMVLCLMGSDSMFALTSASIEAAGWSNITTIDNPDM